MLTGLWFEGSRDERSHSGECGMKQSETCSLARRWLDGYFAGAVPDWLPPMRLEGATPFRASLESASLPSPVGSILLRPAPCLPFSDTMRHDDTNRTRFGIISRHEMQMALQNAERI